MYLLMYAVVMNIWLFSLMGLDKRRSKRKSWRIKERNLWILALAGGAAGGWSGMKLYRHKTKHKTFKLLFPILAIIHLATLAYMASKFYL
ncbi:DUF1294 domain-containing protein [Halobacillus litoralis]|uniref:DUF1294 domain-containing protein n=2 Tax=Halobacillus litoralis TaxID=45668 RepID=A0A410MIY8_9BACI|nr:DUF1294 domain-containing protein [Halobacillus litoralis]